MLALFLYFLITNACVSKTHNTSSLSTTTSSNISSNTSVSADNSKASPKIEFKSEFIIPELNDALKSIEHADVMKKLFNDPGMNSFMNTHQNFDYVFFIATDESISKLSPALISTLKSTEYSLEKFAFLANHVSMVERGMPWIEGVNFNQGKMVLDGDKLLCDGKTYKILKKPNYPKDKIQIFILDKPISS